MQTRKVSKPTLTLVAALAVAVFGATAGPSSAVPSTACASGTDYTTNSAGGYMSVAFNNSLADCTWTVPAGVTSVDYLVVGGGGGAGGGGLYYKADLGWCGNYVPGVDGGHKEGGGGAGGGGGTASSGSSAVVPNSTLAVRVGAGGGGGKAGGCGATGRPSQALTNTADGAGEAGAGGAASSLGSIASASGGTGGAGGSAKGAGAAAGGASGSNSGGVNSRSAADCANVVTTPCFSAPGGAGAGAAGSNPGFAGIGVSGGAGGAGAVWAVNGLTYGGGGGGSTRHPYSQPTASRSGGAGGAGGGAAGSLGNGVSGTDGLGGGGGGGRGNGDWVPGESNAGAGGAGGLGVVVVRYLIPPAAPVISFPLNGSTSNTNALTFNQTAGLTYKCKIDAGALTTCTSPLDVSGLTDGTRTVDVYAYNSAGNLSPAGSVTWTRDATPPAAPVISGAPAAPTSNTSQTFTFTKENNTTAQCSLDGGAFTACSSPLTYEGLSRGSHTLKIKVTDTAGNVGPEASASWTVVAPPPCSPPTVTKPTIELIKGVAYFDWAVRANGRPGNNDARPACALMTLQVSQSTSMPSATVPQKPFKIADGVFTYSSFVITRVGVPAPRWVRVGNRVGQWSAWTQTAVNLKR